MQPDHSKRWLRFVVVTFYAIFPLSLTALAASPPDPYLLPEGEWAKPPATYIEMYEYVEFFEYVEIAEDMSPEVVIEQPELTPESTVTSTPVEAASEPVLVPEQESEPEPEPESVEAVVEEPAPVEQPAEPEPEPPSHSSGVEQWRGLVEAYFPASEVEYALCIMHHESRGDPGATNGSSGAAGLFQFIPSTWSNMVPDELAGDVYDPETNVRAAAWLLGAAGWSQWSPHNRGAC